MLCLPLHICAAWVCSVWTGQYLLIITAASAACRQWKVPEGDVGGEAKEVGNFLCLHFLWDPASVEWPRSCRNPSLLVPGSNFPSPTHRGPSGQWLHPTCAPRFHPLTLTTLLSLTPTPIPCKHPSGVCYLFPSGFDSCADAELHDFDSWSFWVFHIFSKIIVFIYLLGYAGPSVLYRLFSYRLDHGSLLVVVHGLLTAVASPLAEHKL